jgi:hypothetical protein
MSGRDTDDVEDAMDEAPAGGEKEAAIKMLVGSAIAQYGIFESHVLGK